MKASTKTEQPEWARRIALDIYADHFGVEAAVLDGDGPTCNQWTEIISQSPAIKELVEAAEEIAESWRAGCKCRCVVCNTLTTKLQYALKAFQPFKASTGGG